MDFDIIRKKNLIDKYFKKKKYLCLFDILFSEKESASVYIRLDYDKKTSTYRVNFVNLTNMISNKVESWINTNLIYISICGESWKKSLYCMTFSHSIPQ